MARRVMVLVGVCAVVALGCGAGGDDPPPGQPAAPATVAATWTDQQRAYLVALRAIDAGLVASEERAIRRAEATCADISAGALTDQQLVERVVQRLSGGDATVDTAQAQQAVDLMRRHICPHV